MHAVPNRSRSGKNGCILYSLLAVSLAACSSTSTDVLDLSANPVLATDAPHVESGGIDASSLNQEPAAAKSIEFVGVMHNEPSNISIPADEVKQNLVDLQSAGATKLNSSETAAISFKDDDLKYVVKQLLGGLLSANYIISDDVKGKVTFKTETSVPRSAIPSILRDILGRQGYVMKLINGVYQIGTADTIAVLESNSAAGAAGNYVNRVISLERGNVGEVAAAVAQILPAGATVTPVLSDNSLVLRISPADEKPVMDLVGALIQNSNGDDLIAVIPLRESAPETVAASMNTYFASSGVSAREAPLILGLEEQQALLVVARSQSVMDNVRTLVRGLDQSRRDMPSLRVIALKNLPAMELSEQLTKIFTGKVSDAAAPAAGSLQDAGQKADLTNPAESSDSIVIPVNIRNSPSEKTSRLHDKPPAIKSSENAGNAAPPADQAISIVPDTRNNALLVYATFAQFKRIREVVQTLDVPLAQVVIEATIVEVKLNDKLKYGVQAFLRGNGLNIRSSKLAVPADGGEAGGSAIFEVDGPGGTTASLVLEALQTVTDLKIISSPYLTVLDGRAARLSVGDQIPYLVQKTDASQSGTTTTTNQIEVRDVGIILAVTPNIRADNSVVLNVQQEVSTVQANGSGENLNPVIGQRKIDSEVVVRSGKTVLLGGLIQDRVEKIRTGVPGISKLPVIGKLFKQTDNVKDRTELLVMITPRVVRSSLQLDNITHMLRSRAMTQP